MTLLPLISLHWFLGLTRTLHVTVCVTQIILEQSILALVSIIILFFLQSFVIWNDLPCPDRIVDTFDDFKRQLNQGRVIVPKYFYTDHRSMQILHTRLRTGCSSLSYDLYSKNIIKSPLCNCRCGDTENADHFFF